MIRDPNAPTVIFEFEFAFRDSNLAPINITVMDGCWRAALQSDGVTKVYQFTYEDGTVDELVCAPEAIAYQRIIKRTIPAAAHVEDGGRVKVSGTLQ